MRWTTVTLALAIVIAGCDSPTLPQDRELNEAEARWAMQDMDSYEVEMTVGCFCLPELTTWSRVRVQDGAISGVWKVESDIAVDSTLWSAWPTVQEIFDRIRSGPSGDLIVRIEAEYHPTLGYPTSANFIEGPTVADAGVSFHLRDLTPIDQ